MEPHRVLKNVTSDFMHIALEILSASIIDVSPLEIGDVRSSQPIPQKLEK